MQQSWSTSPEDSGDWNMNWGELPYNLDVNGMTAADFMSMSGFPTDQLVNPDGGLPDNFDSLLLGQDAKNDLLAGLGDLDDIAANHDPESFASAAAAAAAAAQQQQQQQQQHVKQSNPQQIQNHQQQPPPQNQQGMAMFNDFDPSSSAFQQMIEGLHGQSVPHQQQHGRQSTSETPVQQDIIHNPGMSQLNGQFDAGSYQNSIGFPPQHPQQQGQSQPQQGIQHMQQQNTFSGVGFSSSTGTSGGPSQRHGAFASHQSDFNSLVAEQQMQQILQAQKIQAMQNQPHLQTQSRSPSVTHSVHSAQSSSPATMSVQPMQHHMINQQIPQQRMASPNMYRSMTPTNQVTPQQNHVAMSAAADFQKAHVMELEHNKRMNQQNLMMQFQPPQQIHEKIHQQMQQQQQQIPGMLGQYNSIVSQPTSASPTPVPQQQQLQFQKHNANFPQNQSQVPVQPVLETPTPRATLKSTQNAISQPPQQPTPQLIKQTPVPVPNQAQIQAHFQQQQQQQMLVVEKQRQMQQQQQQYGEASNGQSASNDQAHAGSPLNTIKQATTSTPRSITPSGLKRSADDSNNGTPVMSNTFISNTEPAKKKTKRPIKKEDPSGSDSSNAGTPVPSGSSMNTSIIDDLLVVPKLGKSEMDQLTHHIKKSRASKHRPSPIAGVDYMVSTGTIKLTNPKSFDKLNPIVAMPSQSGKPLIPELGMLPCEIQGQFALKFKPSSEAAGLEERRSESQELLNEFDKRIEALGKRRPKYTEYPHVFKEQLRADENVKSKAVRQARKVTEEERNKPIRPEVRPNDDVDGATWDLIGLVYIQPDAVRSSVTLGKAVQQTGDFIAAARNDMSKSKTSFDAAVKEKKPESTLRVMREAMERKKFKLLRLLETANAVGDAVVVESLGGHAKFVIGMINTLIFCVKAGDYADKLLRQALETMSKLKYTSASANALANFPPVQKRLLDNGDTETKALTRSVADKISELEAGIKATREAKETAARKAEQEAEEKAKAAAEATAAKVAAADAAANSANAKPRPAAGALPGKSRSTPKAPIKNEVPKVDASRTTEEKKPIQKKPLSTRPDGPRAEVKPIPPAPKASSGFGGGFASLMQAINAPKQKTPPQESKEESNETPEERAKRLRKEARRKLRVTWRPDHELEQIREFKKEESEDDGPTTSAVVTKDAADDRSEGMALRQRPILDDDDDDDLPYIPWMEPTVVNFSVINPRYRARTYVTRGGELPVESEASQWLKNRESQTLMSFYTNVSDIPPTPKSPMHESAALSVEQRIGHLPREGFEEIHQRLQEIRQIGSKNALFHALRRADEEEDRLRAAGQPIRIGISKPGVFAIHGIAGPVYLDSEGFLPDDAAEQSVKIILQKLSSLPTSFSPTPKTKRRADFVDPVVQKAADAVEDICSIFRGALAEPTEPPSWMSLHTQHTQEWRQGYNQDALARREWNAKMEQVKTEKAVTDMYGLFLQATQGGQAAPPSISPPKQLPVPAPFNIPGSGQAQGSQPDQQQHQFQQQMQLLQKLQQMAGGQPPVPPQPAQDPMMAALAMLEQFASAQQSHTPAPPLDPAAFLQQLTQLQQGTSTPVSLPTGIPPPPQPQQTASHNSWDDEEYDPTREDWEMGGSDWGLGRERGGFRDNSGGKAGEKKKKPAKGVLAPHRPANRALIGTKPCMFFKQGTCARGDKCTFRHE